MYVMCWYRKTEVTAEETTGVGAVNLDARLMCQLANLTVYGPI